MDDNPIRQAWKTGAKCQIYSNSRKKWFDGEIASIFHDDEGEWLEIRYDKSMSKQVQRYSSDIRPSSADLKKLRQSKQQKEKKAAEFPFPEPEMKSNTNSTTNADQQERTGWSKGNEVEIFSNTHQEWYLGEVVDIIKDDEGEWLNVVWARANGEAMSKQVQRFSTDVRPAQNENDKEKESDEDLNHLSPTSKTAAERTTKLSAQIQKRKESFPRRAPPFSRTLKPSTWQYPASGNVRRLRKLTNLEERPEEHSKDQLIDDAMSKPKLQNHRNSNKKAKLLEISTWKPKQVQSFIRKLGKEYIKYTTKFRGMNGKRFLSLSESDYKKLRIPKLHACKMLLTIAKNTEGRNGFVQGSDAFEVLNWTNQDVSKWMSTQSNAVSIYEHKFCDHGVDGLLLFDLDDQDLQLIGVRKTHRNKVKQCIAKFKSKCFDLPNEEKDEEPQNNNSNNNSNSNSDNNSSSNFRRHGRRQSVQMSELAGLVNSVHLSQEARDDLMLTMCQLMVELGKVINAGNIPNLANTLERKLNHYTAGNLGVAGEEELKENDDDELDIGNAEELMNKKMQLKTMAEQDGASALGLGLVGAKAWLKTLSNDSGHKRRGSTYISAEQLQQLEEDDEDEVSDLD